MGWPNLVAKKSSNGKKKLLQKVKKYVSICNSVDGKCVSFICTIQIIVVLRFNVCCHSKWTEFRIIKNHVLSLPDFFIIKLAKSVIKKGSWPLDKVFYETLE